MKLILTIEDLKKALESYASFKYNWEHVKVIVDSSTEIKIEIKKISQTEKS